MRERNNYTKVKVDKEKNRYFKPLKYPEIPLSENDIYVITLEGDRVDFIMIQDFGG